MSDQHRPSPSPSAFSSTLPPSFRARLRIRPHAPLPTEPFLLPLNVQITPSFPFGSGTSTDDLRFLAGKIISHVPQAPSELPQPTDLAFYLDGFRLTGWDTKLSDLVRDGDVIDVHHVTRLPSVRQDGGRSSTHKKRKRRREYSESEESESASPSQSSSSSSRHHSTRNKSKRTRRERTADQRGRSEASQVTPSASRPSGSGTVAQDDDLQAEADRIALLIKSEIGGATPPPAAGGRASSRARPSPPLAATDQEDEDVDELPRPPPGLISSIPLPSRSSVPPLSKGLPPAMPLPPPGVGGAAAAMAAFEARKRQTQSTQRNSPSQGSSSATSTREPLPITISDGHAEAVSNVVEESDSDAEDASFSLSSTASTSSSSSSSSSDSESEEKTSHSNENADKVPSEKAAQNGTSSSATSSESSSNSDADSSGSNTKLTPASAVSSQASSSLSGESDSDANDSDSQDVPGDQPNSLSAQALSAHTAATSQAASSSWVIPGQGSSRTKRANAKRRGKVREKMRESQERMFHEAQERVKQREAAQAMANHAATPVNGDAVQEVKVDQSPGDEVQDSDTAPPVADSTNLQKAAEQAPTTERAKSPFATILTYSNDDDEVSETDDASSVLGWSIDVTPTTPMIPYRDPKAPFQPPALLKDNAAIKLDLAKKEKEMTELKERIRKAEEQRKNLPPGGGMFELDFAAEPEKPSAEATTSEVPTANTQALPTSSAVPFTFARPAPAYVGQALASQADRERPAAALTMRPDGPPPAKKAKKVLRPSREQPPVPSTLPPSAIPPNIKLTSVDCEAWYNGEDVHEYLFVPEGQDEKGRAPVNEELEEGEVVDAEDEGTKAYLMMRRSIREDLRKEKELEARQAAIADAAVETQAALALHPDLPLTFSSLKDVKKAAQAPQASTQAKPAVTKPTSTVAASAPVNGSTSTAALDALPTEFGTKKTRAKQLAGKSGRSPNIPKAEVKATPTAAASTSPAAEVELAYLGPPGTYSHQVALNLDIPALLESQPERNVTLKGKGPDVVDLHPCSTITQTLERALQDTGNMPAQKPYRLALLPFANSTFGPVKETESLLTEYKDKMTVLAATKLKVQHSLLVSDATYKALEAAGDISSGHVKQSAFTKIQRVYSHEQAIGQCDLFLKSNLPLTSMTAGRTPVASTALAASIVASNGQMHNQENPLRMEAAIASEICATKGVIPGLRLLKVGIQDKDDNTTKFIIVEVVKASQPPTTSSGAGASASASANGADKRKASAPAVKTSAPTSAPTPAPAPTGPSTSTSTSLPPRPCPPPGPKQKAVHPDFFPGTSSHPGAEATIPVPSSNGSASSANTAGASTTGAPGAPGSGGLDYGEPEPDEPSTAPAAGASGARRISARPMTRKAGSATKPATAPSSSAAAAASLPTKPAAMAAAKPKGAEKTQQGSGGPKPAAEPASSGSAAPVPLSVPAPASVAPVAPAPAATVAASAAAPTSATHSGSVSIQTSTGLSVDETLRLARERALASLKLKKSGVPGGAGTGGSGGQSAP